jgi:hypothetical protein
MKEDNMEEQIGLKDSPCRGCVSDKQWKAKKGYMRGCYGCPKWKCFITLKWHCIQKKFGVDWRALKKVSTVDTLESKEEGTDEE